MRVKTEARRRAILTAAAEVFRERGFDAASMTDVLSRVGGSKATIYNYFPSKVALLSAVMLDAAKHELNPIFEAFAASKDLEPALLRFGHEILAFRLRPDIMALNRMFVAEGERTGLGREVYDKGSKIAWSVFAARIERAMDEGVLRRADPWRAAMHFKGLSDGGIVDRRLRGCGEKDPPEELHEAVVSAVDVFMRAYRA